MQFLNPLFLLGALAVGVPIFLHLIHREKTKKTPFSSLMFVRRIPFKEMQRRRLTHLFLLFLRCLALLLVVAAFGRPVITSAWLNQVNPMVARSMVILIDHSYSMSPPSIWDRAITAARQKIASMGEGDEALLVSFGETTQALSQWTDSPDALQGILSQRLEPSFESTSYVEALRVSVDRLEEARNSRKEILLITDMQNSGMASSAGWRVPGDILVEIEDVGREQSNLFLEEVRVDRAVFTPDYPHAIVARLRSGGGPSQGEAQLFLNGALIDRIPFQAEDEEAISVTFKPFPLEDGISRGKILLEPEDELPQDNVFHFVIEKQKPRQILIFDAQASDQAFYLQSALSSGENLPFRPEVSAPRSLQSLEPETTPLVLINGLASPPNAASVKSYLERGGGLILVLGKAVRAADYNRRWEGLLPAELVERRYVRQADRPFTSMTEVNWEHFIFWIFQSAQKAAITSTQFYSYWELAPVPGASVLARFSQGHPALVEGSVGRGKILLFASSVDPVWTDFPLRSSYVPFWYRMAQYAAGWQGKPAAFRVNRALPVDSAQGDAATSGAWTLIDPRGQRVLGMAADTPGFVRLTLPGYYEIRSNKATDWVAVNSPAEESDLARIGVEEFQTVFVPREGRPDTVGPAATVQEKDRQQSLWWLVLMAAALVFMAEWLVANRSSAPQSSVGMENLREASTK